jgi:hypothetical protein
VACNPKPLRRAFKRAYVIVKKKTIWKQRFGTELEKKVEAEARKLGCGYWQSFDTYWANYKGFKKLRKQGINIKETTVKDLAWARKR